jgi:hypothetical protein
VAIWDQAGLQNQPVKFDSLAARNRGGERPSWRGTGLESEGDPGSGVRFLSSPLWRRGVSSSSSAEVAKLERPPAANRCMRGFDSRPRLQCPRPRCLRLHAGSPGQRSGFDPRWALEDTTGTRGRVAEAPAFQAGDAGSTPAACSVMVQGGLGPGRPHEPGFWSVRFRPLQRKRSRRDWPARHPRGRRGSPPHTRFARASRAGRPRVARLQGGVVWWDDPARLPLRRRWRRARPVSVKGRFESGERLLWSGPLGGFPALPRTYVPIG